MKRLKFQYFAAFIALGLLGAMESSLSQDTYEVLKNLEEVNAGLSVEVEKEACLHCKAVGPDVTISLDKKSHNLGKPYFAKKNEPYVIYLKRSSVSPEKIELTFKNSYEVCGKYYVGAPFGTIQAECMLPLTKFEDEKISVDLRNLPKLEEGQEEIIEIEMTKKDITKTRYSIHAKNLSDSSYKDIWRGDNVKFRALKKQGNK